jgi:hypothetical protein
MFQCKKVPECSDTTSCQEANRQCKCVTVKGDACEPIKTICAYQSGGELFECSVGCCSNQCSGRCSKGKSQKVGEYYDVKKYFTALLILILALVLVSTLSL